MIVQLCDLRLAFPKILKAGDGFWVQGLTPADRLLLLCALSTGTSSTGLSSSVIRGQEPSQLLFLTFLPSEHMKLVSSVAHADKPRFVILPIEFLASNFAQTYKTFKEIILFCS